MEALDNYIDSIKTLPRDWNPKAYIEPPGGESEHEKGLQIPEEEVRLEFLPSRAKCILRHLRCLTMTDVTERLRVW